VTTPFNVGSDKDIGVADLELPWPDVRFDRSRGSAKSVMRKIGAPNSSVASICRCRG
jgi:hypothetical protein